METKVVRQYEEAWNHYSRRFDSAKYMKFTECFSNLIEETSVKNARSMISIGVADATFDKLLLEHALPNLDHVIALEPDTKFNHKIKQSLAKFGKRFVKVDVENVLMQDYEGPAQPVDLVLLANVLSFFPETAEEQVAKCLKWLKPGGHVVITINTNNSILKATDGLRKNGYNACFDGKGLLRDMKLNYTEGNVKILFDLATEDIRYPLRIWIDKMPSEDEVQTFLKRLEKVYLPGTKKSYMTYGFYLIPRQVQN